jgi:4'-phosphopantetheinyl transferase
MLRCDRAARAAVRVKSRMCLSRSESTGLGGPERPAARVAGAVRVAARPLLLPDFVERVPDDPLPLVEREVDLWAFSLAPDEGTVDSLSQALEPSERTRADRYRFREHRRRFIVGRALLRRLLGRYLDLPPEEVRFRFAPRGKPHLAPPHDSSGLCFNLSNSADLALVAFARGVRLGVDVEILRPLSSATALATRFFSARERQELGAIAAADQIQAFFNGWIRKEAFLKALGDGLAMPLASFSVTLSLDSSPRLIHVERADLAADCWTLKAFVPAAGAVGALAIEGTGWRVRRWAADAALWSGG